MHARCIFLVYTSFWCTHHIDIFFFHPITIQAPNVVTVLVEAARNLRPPGSKGTCDPLVVVRCGGKAKQCKALKKTNNPKWHFQAQMGNVDPGEALLIEVLM